MSFLSPDESVILMDWPPHWVSPAGLNRLRHAGVQTAYTYVDWAAVEPSRGAYDWTDMDARVARYHAAGIKAILSGPNTIPAWTPDEWMIALGGKPVREAIDWRLWPCFKPWNIEAMCCEAGFLTRLIDRYANDAVLIVASHSRDGEAILPPYAPVDDLPSGDSLRDVLIESTLMLQRACAEQDKGIWCQLHRYHQIYPWTGNGYVSDIYEALATLGQSVTALNFTHFALAPVQEQAARVQADIARFGFDFIVGAEWAEGLRANTPAAIAQGLRGLLCGPLHPYTGHTELEGWMASNFEWATQQFKKARV